MNQFAKLFDAASVLEGTVVEAFFKDIDTVVGSMRVSRFIAQDPGAFLVTYQDITENDVSKKLLTHNWRILDMPGPNQIKMYNPDGWVVLLTGFTNKNRMFLCTVALLDQAPVVRTPLPMVDSPNA